MTNLPEQIDRLIDTDVLVVGGGGAGAAAAVGAGRCGCRVLAAVKGKIGKSGSTLLSSAVVATDGESARKMGQRRADASLTPDRWFEQIVRHGYFLSEQPLARLFVEQAPAAVSELLRWARRADQPYVFGAGGSWITTGKGIGKALGYGVSRTPGVERFEDVMICELICRENRICGALGVELFSGKLVYIRCRAAVLATGGFQPFSFTCTGADNTGDGIAMALRAGAAIADMEFFLFAPGVLISPRIHRGSILPMFLYGTGQIRPDILTANGTDLMASLSPELQRLAEDRAWFKLVHAVLWSQALAAGGGTPGGGLYFDFGRYSALRYHIGLLLAFSVLKRLYGSRFRFQGRNVRDLFETIRRRGRWEVGLCAEYSLGGVVVDTAMATSVHGLYAAGEVTSGTFGANRTTRALTEMLVQGFAAGRSAAVFAGSADAPSPEGGRLQEVCRKILAPLKRGKNGADCQRVITEAEKTADACLGVRRSFSDLSAGLRTVTGLIEEHLPRLAVSFPGRRYNLEWMQALQLENRLVCLEASIRSALERSESRGQHLRIDHPGVDNARGLCRHHLIRRNGALAVEKKPPGFDHLSPPPENFASVIEYALFCRRNEQTENKWRWS